jgi:hypothetical protein
MNKGVILFAHNNRQIDYAKMSILAGKLAKKNLGVPVSLITDPSTMDWMRESNILKISTEIFDQIIITQRPEDNNMKNYSDGKNTTPAPFSNGNRFSAYDLSPYDRTLLIDTDYLVLSDSLNQYWNVESDLLISPGYNDIIGKERVGYLDSHISETGVEMYWATTVMFTKNENTKMFFDLVEYIKEQYKMFADVFRFDTRTFRNDIAFSIAKHIMNGYQKVDEYNLPDVFSVADKDILCDVSNGSLKFLIAKTEGYVSASVKDRDIHIMNKFSIDRNYEKLMELAE